MKTSIKNTMLSVAFAAMMPFYGCNNTDYAVVPTAYYATNFPTKLFNCNTIYAVGVVDTKFQKELISVEQFDKNHYSVAETDFPEAKVFAYKILGSNRDAGYIYLLVLDSNNISLPVMKKEMKLLERLAHGNFNSIQNKIPGMAAKPESALEKSVDSYQGNLPNPQMNVLHISLPKNYHPTDF